MGRETALFGPAPWDPGRGGGQKFKYHLISITSQLKSFLYKALCVFSQMKDTKTDQTGFSFCCLGHVVGVGLGGT